MKLTAIIILFCSIHIGCKKENNFSWAKNGKIFYYDQYKGSNIVKDYIQLAIYDNQFFQNNVAAPLPMDILDRKFVIKKNGLFGLACEDCSIGYFTCGKEFEFLYAPNSPSLNQQIPQYSCGRIPSYNIQIINVDTTISVPLGIFKTYVMLHYYGDRSYWSTDNGLIMYEKVDRNNRATISETYKLTRIQ